MKRGEEAYFLKCKQEKWEKELASLVKKQENELTNFANKMNSAYNQFKKERALKFDKFLNNKPDSEVQNVFERAGSVPQHAVN